jgi:hypothetical protein
MTGFLSLALLVSLLSPLDNIESKSLTRHVDYQIQNILTCLRDNIGISDGMAALIALQDNCFAQDPFQQSSAIAKFEILIFGANEPIVEI